jgi:hypothetical protein
MLLKSPDECDRTSEDYRFTSKWSRWKIGRSCDADCARRRRRRIPSSLRGSVDDIAASEYILL